MVVVTHTLRTPHVDSVGRLAVLEAPHSIFLKPLLHLPTVTETVAYQFGLKAPFYEQNLGVGVGAKYSAQIQDLQSPL